MQLRLLLAAFTVITFSACINNDVSHTANIKAASDTANFTTIQWIDSVRNFDKITEGQKLEVIYRFKNTGSKPLIITDVRPGCGCTVADRPAEPIMPGREGQIKAAFDSEGHPGEQHKNITVQANTRPVQSFELQFNVQVDKKS